MKTAIKTLKPLVLLCIVICCSCSSDDTQQVTRLNQLSMADEFNVDGAPNSDIWNYDIGTGQNGWGNNELQYYTDRPENAVVQNGFLIITAREEDFQGSRYTSARLLTRGKFQQQYGRFEARMRLPFGKGLWPAFWLLGDDRNGTQIWPQIGEIDIMEYLGDAPTESFGTIHGPGYSAGESIGKTFNLENDRFDTGFHIFGIEWGPSFINFYVDDTIYNQITPDDVPGEWVFDRPFYILLNVAVGGNLPGSPNQETIFPQTMLVDYVRVYNN